jgi:hypothetical protein
LLKFVDLLGYEEGINEGKVWVWEVSIVPDFLGYQERAQDQWPPVCWLKWHLRKSDQSVNVHQTYDAAFWTRIKLLFNECYLRYLNCAQS